MFEPNLIAPEVGFKFLGFPNIKVNIFKDKSKTESILNLIRKGVSIADLDFIESDPENENSTFKRRRYTLNNGRSSMFIYKTEEILERCKETPLYRKVINLQK